MLLSLIMTLQSLRISYTFPIHYLGKPMYFLYFPYTLPGKTYVFPTLSPYITWKSLRNSYNFLMHYLGKLVYLLHLPSTLPLHTQWGKPKYFLRFSCVVPMCFLCLARYMVKAVKNFLRLRRAVGFLILFLLKWLKIAKNRVSARRGGKFLCF